MCVLESGLNLNLTSFYHFKIINSGEAGIFMSCRLAKLFKERVEKCFERRVKGTFLVPSTKFIVSISNTGFQKDIFRFFVDDGGSPEFAPTY